MIIPDENDTDSWTRTRQNGLKIFRFVRRLSFSFYHDPLADDGDANVRSGRSGICATFNIPRCLSTNRI